MAVTRAVSHGRESVCQGRVTHGGADEEPKSIACLYSKEVVASSIASGGRCYQEGE